MYEESSILWRRLIKSRGPYLDLRGNAYFVAGVGVKPLPAAGFPLQLKRNSASNSQTSESFVFTQKVSLPSREIGSRGKLKRMSPMNSRSFTSCASLRN